MEIWKCEEKEKGCNMKEENVIEQTEEQKIEKTTETTKEFANKAKEKLKSISKWAYNHPKFKDWIVVSGVLVYLLAFFNINTFLLGYFNIGHFDFDAPMFGFSEMGWLDFLVLAIVTVPLISIGTLTKASFYNLAPKAWSSTKNRYGIEAMRESEEWKDAWFIGKIWIILKKTYRFFVLVFMVVFSPMLPFWIVWGLLASYLYFNTEFFTFWRLVLLTMPAVIAYDRLWVNINWWATKRRNTDIGGSPEGNNEDVEDSSSE